MQRYISDKDRRYYTYMLDILNSIGGRKLNYNWLITDIEAYPYKDGKLDDEINSLLYEKDYLILSNNRLMSILQENDFQWTWAVFSAIPEKYSKEEIMKFKMPYADGNYLIYKDKPIIQHPLAEIEIVAFDSTCVQITAKDDEVAELFKNRYPLSRENY